MHLLITRFHRLLLLFLCIALTIPAFSQAPQRAASLESLINRYVLTYGLSHSNRFKLAAYTELKGRYDSEAHALILDFGGLGYLSFYERNCLLRLPGNRIYSLDRFETGTPAVAEMDQQLDALFERIILLSDGEAPAAKRAFIDRHLATKNLEPFAKLFIRHLLVHYGEFDPMLQEVHFHSKSLPVANQERMVQAPGSTGPVKIRLDSKTLRGWYLNSGGTVYINNVDREVRFATGEEYDYNVSAFKIFAQKLFVQSVQHIAQRENDRLARLQDNGRTMNKMVTIDQEVEQAHTFASREERELAQVENRWRRTYNQVQPLYSAYSWIPMMLTMLRNERVNIGDADVICYFVDLEAFERIYIQLVPEEREKVDRYLQQRGLPLPALAMRE